MLKVSGRGYLSVLHKIANIIQKLLVITLRGQASTERIGQRSLP